jgi:uncharacterized protein (DUF58 family)
MRPTRRGWAAVAVVLVAVVLAWTFGERSLNAVAAPTLAALAAAFVAVWRADPPTVAFDDPRAGFPGEERTLSFHVEGDGLAKVSQSLPAGLTTRPVDETVALPRGFDQQVALEARGVYEVGPPEVRQRDPLGLIERRAEADSTAELVVYPQVYALADPTLGGILADPATAERQEFDRLREYVPGDPLKNVHWKSSAKRGEFLVMEFSPTERTETLRIAATAEAGGADRMSGAAATLTDAALEAGLTVELWVPDGHLPPGKGEVHRENAMQLLATAGHGSVADAVRAGADVTIEAGPRSTAVGFPERQRSFESLVTGRKQRTDTAVNREADPDTREAGTEATA